MDFSLFHFLRPQLLLLLIPILFLLWVIWRQSDMQRGWRKIIATHLLDHLIVDTEGRVHRWRPIVALTLVWVLGCIALAGPSWEREPAPFGEETAALVVVLKVTPSMLAQDIQPTRLERAKHKISDLLAERAGGRTALIAYSGSVHVVMPMTSDARIIEQFAGELSPEIMPVEGDTVADAIELAKATLSASGLAGSIIVLADEVATNQLELLASGYVGDDPQTHILAMAAGPDEPAPLDGPPAPALDEATMQQAAANVGGSLVKLTADARDVERLARLAESSVASVVQGQGETWKDAGYYLIPVLALLLLLGFRPGWMVRYQ